VAALALAALAWPAVAGAHGSFGRAYLPVPTWLFAWAAGAVLAVGYALVQLIGIACFGIERWSERSDAFGVAFNLFSRLSPLEYRDRAIWRRPLLSGLIGMREMPGTVALLCAMIGTTTFDGFLNGPVWRSIAPPLERDLERIGLVGTAALELTFTLGLLACVLLCAGLYGLGVRGMSSVSADHPTRELARRFIHSLAPIAFGYGR
jgi:hypothetical protein